MGGRSRTPLRRALRAVHGPVGDGVLTRGNTGQGRAGGVAGRDVTGGASGTEYLCRHVALKKHAELHWPKLCNYA